MVNQVKVDPLIAPIPTRFLEDRNLRPYFEYKDKLIHDLIKRTENLEARIVSAGILAVDITANYTTTGSQVITCLNTSPITITLNSSPVDKEELDVKRKESQVIISGTIDGSSSLTLASQYDAVRLRYSSTAGEWGVM